MKSCVVVVVFLNCGLTIYQLKHLLDRGPGSEDGDGLVAKSCPTLGTPWAVACQVPLSMGFPRQEYWNGLLFPSPGDLPRLGIDRRILYHGATREAPSILVPCSIIVLYQFV